MGAEGSEGCTHMLEGCIITPHLRTLLPVEETEREEVERPTPPPPPPPPKSSSAREWSAFST